MAIITKGQTFADGDQVTSAKLNNLVDLATFKTGSGEAVDGTTLLVDAGGYLKAGTMQTGNLATGSVTTAKLADSTGASDGVTTAKLATGAVTTAKIADTSVTTAKLADSAVTGAKIFAGSGSFPIQVTQTVKTDTQTIAGHPTAWTDVSGLSLTLTRLNVAGTGKVRVQATVNNTSNNALNGVAFRIMRGATVIGVGAAAGNRVVAGANGGYPGQYGQFSTVIDFIDDHDLTDATITYKVQARIFSGAIGYINRGSTDTDLADYIYRTISTLTLTEMV
jgi:hypothetical protein